MPGEPSSRVADQLAYVCVHADQLKAALTGSPAGERALLDRLFAEVCAGGEIASLLDALTSVLVAAGDAGMLGADTRGMRLPGIDTISPRETVYMCPGGRCSRVVDAAVTPPPPICGIFGQELARERL